MFKRQLGTEEDICSVSYWERVAEGSWYDCGSIQICQSYVAITNKLVSKTITTVQRSSIVTEYPGLVSD